MAPGLRFWSFDCTSCPSYLVPSICPGERTQYYELLPCLCKMHIRRYASMTRFMHWGDMRSWSKQLQTEHWIPLFIVSFVFHLVEFFHWSFYLSWSSYTHHFHSSPYSICPFFYLSISLKKKNQILLISWVSSLFSWLLLIPMTPRLHLLSQRLIRVFTNKVISLSKRNTVTSF